jgi:hypothetical protein
MRLKLCLFKTGQPTHSSYTACPAPMARRVRQEFSGRPAGLDRILLSQNAVQSSHSGPQLERFAA